MAHHENTKPKNNRHRRKRRSSTQSTENIFNKIIEENLPSKIYKELKKLVIKRTNNPVKLKSGMQT